MTMLAVLK